MADAVWRLAERAIDEQKRLMWRQVVHSPMMTLECLSSYTVNQSDVLIDNTMSLAHSKYLQFKPDVAAAAAAAAATAVSVPTTPKTPTTPTGTGTPMQLATPPPQHKYVLSPRSQWPFAESTAPDDAEEDEPVKVSMADITPGLHLRDKRTRAPRAPPRTSVRQLFCVVPAAAAAGAAS